MLSVLSITVRKLPKKRRSLEYPMKTLILDKTDEKVATVSHLWATTPPPVGGVEKRTPPNSSLVNNKGGVH